MLFILKSRRLRFFLYVVRAMLLLIKILLFCWLLDPVNITMKSEFLCNESRVRKMNGTRMERWFLPLIHDINKFVVMCLMLLVSVHGAVALVPTVMLLCKMKWDGSWRWINLQGLIQFATFYWNWLYSVVSASRMLVEAEIMGFTFSNGCRLFLLKYPFRFILAYAAWW